MSGIDLVAEGLGGYRVLGRRVRSDDDLAQIVREGLPVESLDRLMATYGLSFD